MQPTANAVLVMILLINLFVLGSGRIRTIIYAVAMHGVILSLLPALLHGNLGIREGIVSVAALLLKGVIIPRMLLRAMADLPIRREIEPIVTVRPLRFEAIERLRDAQAIPVVSDVEQPAAGGTAEGGVRQLDRGLAPRVDASLEGKLAHREVNLRRACRPFIPVRTDGIN